MQQVQSEFNLKPFNSLALPAIAAKYVAVNSEQQIQQALNYANENALAIHILGEGSNTVFANRINALVLQPKLLGRCVTQRDQNQVQVEVAAGENWHQFVQWAIDQGAFGIENLALIPGSCGAAPVQNIGAYGTELGNWVSFVEYINLADGQLKRLSQKDCLFHYRDSIFKNKLAKKTVITKVGFCLSAQSVLCVDYPALLSKFVQSPPKTAQEVFDAVCSVRRSKLPDPQELPNVGSFFKNPVIEQSQWQQLIRQHPNMPSYETKKQGSTKSSVKIPAGWLIDQLGWKGKREGDVAVHTQQALVLVNMGQATTVELLEFAEKVKQDVQQQFAITLEIEPQIVG